MEVIHKDGLVGIVLPFNGYIRIPIGHPWVDQEPEVHGGVTWSGIPPPCVEGHQFEKEPGYWIGWDYRHCVTMNDFINGISYGVKVSPNLVRKEVREVLNRAVILNKAQQYPVYNVPTTNRFQVLGKF